MFRIISKDQTDGKTSEFEVDISEYVEVEHNVPPELADTLEFEDSDASINHQDSSGNSSDQTLTPSEKIEQVRSEHRDDQKEHE